MGITYSPTKILDLDITTAISLTEDSFRFVPRSIRGVLIYADFTYGSGGTNVKCYLQTSIDGTNGIDIANFTFTTSNALKLYNLNRRENNTSIVTPTDAAITDNTSISGILSDRIRVKYVTTGTYANTNLKIWLYYW